MTPVAAPDGETSHFIGIQRDVTSRKRRERLIGVLNRVLRHNLRNDMSIVAGLGDTIATAADGKIAAQAETVTETARDLMSVSEKARQSRRRSGTTLRHGRSILSRSSKERSGSSRRRIRRRRSSVNYRTSSRR